MCTQPGKLIECRGLFADRCGDVALCCVREAAEGWVVKRSESGKGFAPLLRPDFVPTAFAAAEDTFWIARQGAVLEYIIYDHRSAWILGLGQAGPNHNRTCRVPGHVVYMHSATTDKLYIITQEGGLHLLDLPSGTCELLTRNVQRSSGLAVLQSSVLFISQGGDICALDMASHEVRVVGTDKVTAGQFVHQAAGWPLSLLLVPRPASAQPNEPRPRREPLTSGFYTCNEEGQLCQVAPPATQEPSSNLAVSDRWGVLFLTQAPGSDHYQLRRLPVHSFSGWRVRLLLYCVALRGLAILLFVLLMVVSAIVQLRSDRTEWQPSSDDVPASRVVRKGRKGPQSAVRAKEFARYPMMSLRSS
ncbi:hypothetical protein QJQ45_003609 [Haematococcus lacustris]|nr:hypothetical protein QJQ45_003609 [Haematococcus lacustris]